MSVRVPCEYLNIVFSFRNSGDAVTLVFLSITYPVLNLKKNSVGLNTGNYIERLKYIENNISNNL